MALLSPSNSLVSSLSLPCLYLSLRHLFSFSSPSFSNLTTTLFSSTHSFIVSLLSQAMVVVCEFGGLSLNLVGALFDLQWLGNLSWMWVVVCNGHGSPVVVLVCYGFFFFFFIWVFGGGGFAMGWLRVSL